MEMTLPQLFLLNMRIGQFNERGINKQIARQNKSNAEREMRKRFGR